MSRARVAVLKAASGASSVTAAAAEYGYSRRHCTASWPDTDEHQTTVADLTTGEILSTHQIEPNKTYWRNQHREPGRWPSSRN